MKTPEYFTERITEILAGSTHRIQHFTTKLRLIESVENIYSHIAELDMLIDLLKTGLGGYMKEYYPEIEADTLFCAEIAENTRYNHYHNEKAFNIYDALILCDIKKREFKKIYS